MQMLLSIVVASSLVLGCKPSDDASGGKSLDNFAREGGQSARPNQCGFEITKERYAKLLPSAKAKVARIQGASSALRLAAASALTSVPDPVQTFFYGSGGRIILSTDVSADCKNAELTAGEKEFVGERSGQAIGCWRRNGKRVEIVLAADAKVIRHNTVRMFAYLYSQYFVERFALAQLPDRIAKRVKSGVSRFAKQRSALASAFLADLSEKKSSALPRLLRLEARDSKAFENFVFAEAIDSYFCSRSTQSTFKQQFPTTYAAFTSGGDDLASDFGSPWYR